MVIHDDDHGDGDNDPWRWVATRGMSVQCSVCVAYLGHVPVDEAVTREGGGGFEHVGHGRHLGRGRGMRVVL